jgi:hypothetical protein
MRAPLLLNYLLVPSPLLNLLRVFVWEDSRLGDEGMCEGDGWSEIWFGNRNVSILGILK